MALDVRGIENGPPSSGRRLVLALCAPITSEAVPGAMVALTWPTAVMFSLKIRSTGELAAGVRRS